MKAALFISLALVATFGWTVQAQVNIPEGFEIVRFGYTENSIGSPRMNNCGEIAYQERMGSSTADWEIMLYDNGRLRNVTNNDDWDAVPQINDSGAILLLRGPGNHAPDQILWLVGGEETRFDENSLGFGSASINNAGHVAWSRTLSPDCPIRSATFLWNGLRTIQISPDELYDQAESLNDLDQVAYMHTDFCVNPWAGDIRLFLSRHETLILPSEEVQVQGPSLNNVGHVVWRAPAGIELWDGEQTSLLADRGAAPEINNLGDVYFTRGGEIPYSAQPWLYRVSGGQPEFHRLASDGARHTKGDINDFGEAAWIWKESLAEAPRQIWYLRRVRSGDADFDGNVDLDDNVGFVSCMTGPGRIDRLCDCRFLDIDHDGDVDLGDFAQFQNAFGANP